MDDTGISASNKASIGRIAPRGNTISEKPAIPGLSKEAVPTIKALHGINAKSPNMVRSVEMLRKLKRKKNVGVRQNRASMLFQVLALGSAIASDTLQAILDLVGAAEAVDWALDIGVGGGLLIAMYVKDIDPFVHWKLYGSVATAIIGESIPGVDAAPFWTIDVLYIIHTLKKEDAVHNAQIDADEKDDEQRQMRLLIQQQHYRQENEQQEADTA